MFLVDLIALRAAAAVYIGLPFSRIAAVWLTFLKPFAAAVRVILRVVLFTRLFLGDLVYRKC